MGRQAQSEASKVQEGKHQAGWTPSYRHRKRGRRLDEKRTSTYYVQQANIDIFKKRHRHTKRDTHTQKNYPFPHIG